MRIALAQMKNEGTIQDNLDKSIEFIRQAYENHAASSYFPKFSLQNSFHNIRERMYHNIDLNLIQKK